MTEGPLPQQDTDSVSVIVPCYNAARFLPRAVASALAQTGIAAPQIVLVDDGSTDGTAQVIADLATRHPEVAAYANPQNLGPAGTRNHAISRATGTWIAVLDADDAYAPDRLARLIAAAKGADLDVIADLPVLFDLAAMQAAPEQMPASGTLDRLKFADFLRHDPETGLDPGLLKPVFHRGLVERGLLHYPDAVRHGEDVALYITLCRAGARFGLLREAHYLFSTRLGAISGAFSPGSVTEVDYIAVARQFAELRASLSADRPLEPELDALLVARHAGALQLNRRYGWTLLRRREFRRLRRWLAQSPENRRALMDVIAAKLKGHRGLPD